MILYIIISILAVFIAYVAGQQKNKRILLVAFCLPTIFLSIRYNFGSDYMGYLDHYYLTIRWSIMECLKATRFESGWALLCKLSQPIGFFGFVIILTIFEMTIFYYLIIKYVPSKYYWLAIFILLLKPTLMLTFSSMMRQSLAICMGLLAFDRLLEEKKISPIFLILAATQIHTSAYILLPLLSLEFIGKINISRAKLMTILLLMIISLFLLYNWLNSSFNQLLSIDQFEYYGAYVGNESTTSFGIGDIFSILILGMIYYNQNKYTIDVKKMSLLYSLYFPFLFLTFNIPLLSRLGFYFLPYEIICYSNLMLNIKNNLFRAFVISVIILYTFYSLYTLYNSVWGSYFQDYLTIFSSNQWY